MNAIFDYKFSVSVCSPVCIRLVSTTLNVLLRVRVNAIDTTTYSIDPRHRRSRCDRSLH